MMNTYNIGPLTMRYVFERSGLTNVSDWQAVMDAAESALEMQGLAAFAVARDFINKHHISCPEATGEDRVYENAPLLVEALADVVGYYEYPENEE